MLTRRDVLIIGACFSLFATFSSPSLQQVHDIVVSLALISILGILTGIVYSIWGFRRWLDFSMVIDQGVEWVYAKGSRLCDDIGVIYQTICVVVVKLYKFFERLLRGHQGKPTRL
jgi:hypothetical protein